MTKLSALPALPFSPRGSEVIEKSRFDASEMHGLPGVARLFGRRQRGLDLLQLHAFEVIRDPFEKPRFRHVPQVVLVDPVLQSLRRTVEQHPQINGSLDLQVAQVLRAHRQAQHHDVVLPCDLASRPLLQPRRTPR
jgi:hypothetical protein